MVLRADAIDSDAGAQLDYQETARVAERVNQRRIAQFWRMPSILRTRRRRTFPIAAIISLDGCISLPLRNYSLTG